MRILQLCGRVPWPLTDGGRIAMYNMARGLLHSGATVRVLAFNTSRHHVTKEAIASIPGIQVEAVEIDTRLHAAAAVRDALLRRSYHITRFASEEFAARLQQILANEEFDVVQLESLVFAQYLPVIRRSTKALVTLRALNVEHEIWERLAAEAASPLRRLYLRTAARHLRSYEVSAIDRFDAIVAISRRDAESFRRLGYENPLHVAPVGVFAAEYESGSGSARAGTVGHLGSLDWQPNQEGVRWLLEKIWPRVKQSRPDATLTIGGSNPPQWMAELATAHGAVLESDVADAREFMKRHSLMVVPLRSGGGMRVKIIEALALGAPVVATPVGAEGVDTAGGDALIIAGDEVSFADAIISALGSPEDLARLARAGRELVKSHYDAGVVARGVVEFYRSLSAR